MQRMSVIWEMGLEASEWQGPSPNNSLFVIHYSSLNKINGGVCTAEEGKEGRRHQELTAASACALFPFHAVFLLTKREDSAKEERWWMVTSEHGYFWCSIFFCLVKSPKLYFLPPVPTGTAAWWVAAY